MQKGWKSERQAWFFCLRFALLMATWDVYRLPVAFRIMRRKTDPAYQTENALFREMVSRFVPPPWATHVIIEGDSESQRAYHARHRPTAENPVLIVMWRASRLALVEAS